MEWLRKVSMSLGPCFLLLSILIALLFVFYSILFYSILFYSIQFYSTYMLVSLIALKVFPCKGGGPISAALAAVQWATDHFLSNGKKPSLVK